MRRAARAAALACAALAAAWTAVGAGEAPSAPGPRILVISAATTLADEVYRLDADIRYELGPAAEEALRNGVPLTFVVEIEILRPRRWLWDPTVARLEQRYVLRHHALSERFVVEHRNTGERRSFRSLAAALRALGTLRAIPILDRRILRVGATYEARLRARLDVEALPVPLRPFAYVDRDWRLLRSPWFRWRLAS